MYDYVYKKQKNTNDKRWKTGEIRNGWKLRQIDERWRCVTMKKDVNKNTRRNPWEPMEEGEIRTGWKLTLNSKQWTQLHHQIISPGRHLLHGVPHQVQVQRHLEPVIAEVGEVNVSIEAHSWLWALLQALPDLLHQFRLQTNSYHFFLLLFIYFYFLTLFSCFIIWSFFLTLLSYIFLLNLSVSNHFRPGFRGV